MVKKAQSDKNSLVGKKLGGRYHLQQILASGGMARIYKATDTTLERVVAVKVLMSELVDMDDTLVERFNREAKAVAQLLHDNIVHVYDYGRQGDSYYIVMNFIEGIDLADEIGILRREEKLMDVDRALRILGQVASALDYAHAAGIIHRDIKPSNILLDKQDKAILTDFGLVLRQSIDQTMGTAFGTPRYIAPEQALASESAVPQSDIYALAVVVYEILTGDMLFRADTPMQIALSHISQAPTNPREINPNIPEAAEREILKALDKEPLNRHRSATEFINALKAAYKGVKPADRNQIPADVRTPIFSESQAYKQAMVTAVTPPEPNAALKDDWTLSGIEKPTVDDAQPPKSDSWDLPDTARPPAIAGMKAKLPEKLKNLPQKQLIGGAIGAALLGVFVLIGILLSSGGDPSTLPSDITTDGAPPTNASTAPPALITGGVPLSFAYDSTALIIRNPNSADLDVSALSITKPGETDGISGTQIRQNKIPAGNCVSLVQAGRAFDARTWDCGSGKDYAKIDVAGQQLFWRTARPQQFEVRINGEVIARCDTIRRDSTGQCTFNLPS